MSQKVEQAWFTTESLRKYKIRSECMKRVYKSTTQFFGKKGNEIFFLLQNQII